MVILNCDFCGEEFSRQYLNKRNKHTFCSNDCSTKWNNMQHKIEVTQVCLQCGSKVKTHKHKFCNRSCAAKYNNSNRIKRTTDGKPIKLCSCGKLSKNGRCKSCYVLEQIDKLGTFTKGQIFSTSKNWQSARNTIRKHAVRIYNLSGKEKKCQHCGYKSHTEICHIKPVAEFTDDTLLNEINDIKNLISLCPTHHWEFDNEILKL